MTVARGAPAAESLAPELVACSLEQRRLLEQPVEVARGASCKVRVAVAVLGSDTCGTTGDSEKLAARNWQQW